MGHRSARRGTGWRRWWRAALVGCLAVGAGVVVPGAASADAGWTLVELQPLPGEDDWTIARGVDGAGRAFGESTSVAVRWDTAGNPTALPLPEGCSGGVVVHVNDGGDAVGATYCADVQTSVLWPSDGGVAKLPSGFQPYDVNDGGIIAGRQGAHAAVIVPGYGVVPLVDTGCTFSAAEAISDGGLVVGSCTVPNDVTVALGWYGPYVFPLLPVGFVHSRSVDVSDTAILAYGSGDGSGFADAAQRAYVLDGRGRARVGSGDFRETPAALNAHGVVVGNRRPPVGSGSEPVLFVYGTTVPLTDLVEVPAHFATGLGSATGINGRFEIVGRTSSVTSDARAWLLRPPGR